MPPSPTATEPFSPKPHQTGWAWPWVALGLALVWVVALRVPLALNAASHLDSDLAVDGIVLAEAMHAQFRWHYPGTPFIGSIPVLLSLGPALVAGVGPGSLVAGGLISACLLVAATFWLNWRAFGPGVAVWGLIPLTFASTGAIWLSGRITGGHLLTAVWFAGAFALLAEEWRRGGSWGWAATLGVWFGLGLYLDSMFAAAWVGLGAAVSVGGWWGASRPRSAKRAMASLLAFAIGAGVGMAPRFVGASVDPYDCYGAQFRPIFDYMTVVDKNLWHLLFDCEPRLIAGHRLPGMEIDPIILPDGSRPLPRESVGYLLPAVTLMSLLLFAGGCLRLIRGPVGGDLRSKAIAWGIVMASLVIVTGFLVAPNIENSDNYRYLVFLLVPWSSGFGLMFARWWAGGKVSRGMALALGVAFSVLMTADVSRWYGRLGWVDGSGWRPIQVVPADPTLVWLNDHPEVSAIFGDYWDVYRLSFLTGGRVVGVPLPIYPNRFPEVTRQFPGGRPETLVVIDSPKSHSFEYRDLALRQGGREIAAGSGWSIVHWPSPPAPQRFVP